MRITHNEDYYKLKCIEYFFDKGLLVYGNQATIKRYYNLNVIYLENRRWAIQTDNLDWETLYKNKESFLTQFYNMLNDVRLKGEDKNEQSTFIR